MKAVGEDGCCPGAVWGRVSLLGVETRFRKGRRLSSAITGDGRPHEPSAYNSNTNAPSFRALGATDCEPNQPYGAPISGPHAQTNACPVT